MKIALAQLNYTIGAFDENVNKILSAIRKARQSGAELVVFSELAVCGYPPLDLLEHRTFIEKCDEVDTSYCIRMPWYCRNCWRTFGKQQSFREEPLQFSLFAGRGFHSEGV